MKNPFIKEDHSGLWIAAMITGALTAGAAVWIYIIGKRGAETRAYRHEHAQDYLAAKRHQKNKHKTDVSELADLVHHPQASQAYQS